MKNYQCKKCSTHIISDKRPSSLSCPKKGLHEWKDLGKIGDTNYQCKKCSTLIKSASRPSGIGCPNGGMHQWNRL